MTITAGFTGTVFRSRWPEAVIPPMALPQFLLAAADRGDRPALIDGLTGRVTSYGEFAALMGRVAAGHLRPHVGMVVPLERTTEAMRAIGDRTTTGRVVVKVR